MLRKARIDTAQALRQVRRLMLHGRRCRYGRCCRLGRFRHAVALAVQDTGRAAKIGRMQGDGAAPDAGDIRQHLFRPHVQRQLADIVANAFQHVGQKLLFCVNIGRRASIQITADRYGHLSADDLVDMVDGLAAA